MVFWCFVELGRLQIHNRFFQNQVTIFRILVRVMHCSSTFISLSRACCMLFYFIKFSTKVDCDMIYYIGFYVFSKTHHGIRLQAYS